MRDRLGYAVELLQLFSGYNNTPELHRDRNSSRFSSTAMSVIYVGLVSPRNFQGGILGFQRLIACFLTVGISKFKTITSILVSENVFYKTYDITFSYFMHY
jgi:hypothetical protein